MSSTAEQRTATVQVDGEPVVVDGQTTGAELKAFVRTAPDTLLTYSTGGAVRRVADDELVLQHVSAGAELATWTDWRFGPLLVGGRY